MLDTGYWILDTGYWILDAGIFIMLKRYRIGFNNNFTGKGESLMSYKKLDIWKQAKALVIDIHKMTITELPKFEMYETGSQIRRSVKSVKSTIVEGYGHRSYKNEFIRFLIYAIASNDETIDHLETLCETGSLNNKALYQDLHNRLIILGKMLNNFISSVQANHLSPK